jgi:GT2 family glycosyltransferase
MKLSVIIICWNDLKVIDDCLRSVFDQTSQIDFEVIVSDNGSNDGSVEHIRKHFSTVRIVENGANLGFAKGNNAGIKMAQGEYVLILNPDTLIRDHALEKLVAFADKHPEAGAFGCRVLNPDGSYQPSARPLPTVKGWIMGALCLAWLGKFFAWFPSDRYSGWEGRTERPIGFQSGCCILFRGNLLQKLGGFDERFFYHFEETDLCCRVWQLGLPILFFPGAEITHLGGQSVGRFPIRFALETYRGGYRYFYKHYGVKGVTVIHKVYLLRFRLRLAAYGVLRIFKRTEALENRLKLYRVAIKWHSQLDPLKFITTGAEPDVGFEPLAPAPIMVEPAHRSIAN